MRLYIHIPFCRQKCAYCKFALTPFVKEVQVAKYVSVLLEEIREFLADFRIQRPKESIDSIYFWGGTPSAIPLLYIEKILNEIRKESSCSKNIEISFECNPEDVTKSFAKELYELGINRVSLGVQTLSQDSLSFIGRGGTKKQIFQAIEHLFRSGFTNINTDFILGLPKVGKSEIYAGIQEIHTAFPQIKHTSVYFLEKGIYPKDWESFSISEEEACEEYFAIQEFLRNDRKFHQYEISNFAYPEFESQHNFGYWRRQECRWFGLSAASLLRGFDESKKSFHSEISEQKTYQTESRSANAASFSGYYQWKKEEEILSLEDVRIEEILCGLRTFNADKNLFQKKEELESFIKKWWLAEADGKIFPTSTWIFILDCIIGELV